MAPTHEVSPRAALADESALRRAWGEIVEEEAPAAEHARLYDLLPVLLEPVARALDEGRHVTPPETGLGLEQLIRAYSLVRRAFGRISADSESLSRAVDAVLAAAAGRGAALRTATLDAVAQLGLLARGGEESGAVLTMAAEAIRRVLATDAAAVLERSDGRLVVRAADGWRGSFHDMPISPAALERGELGEDPTLAAQSVEDAVVAPIELPAQPDYGLVLAMSRRTRRFGGEEVLFVRTVATIVAAALAQTAAQQEIRRSVESREQLLGMLAHDLRNPLNAITLGAALLGRGPLEEAQKRQIETIARASRRMQRIINDLLDVSTIQGGRLTLKTGQHRLGSLIEEAVAAALPAAQEKKIELTTSVAAPDEPLHGDRVRLLQALGNLLTNAIQYTSSGGQVRVSAHPSAGGVELAVADTGPGIAPADLPKIFLPYWSAAKNQPRGAGLGLFISRGIVERHGGRIDAESELGRGSTFRVWLPRP